MADDYKFQASPIVNGAMVNVRAADAKEFSEALKFLAENSVDLAQWITSIQNAGNVTGTFGGQIKSVEHGNPPPGPAAVTPAAQGGEAAPSCQHGNRVYKSGGSGPKAWTAWMCPAKQGDPSRCKPLDAKTGELWK